MGVLFFDDYGPEVEGSFLRSLCCDSARDRTITHGLFVTLGFMRCDRGDLWWACTTGEEHSRAGAVADARRDAASSALTLRLRAG